MYLETFLPKHCQKGFKEPRYSSLLESEAELFIHKHYLKGDKTTQTSLYDSFKGYCSTKLNLCEHEIPSREWFRKQVNKIPEFVRIKKRKGATALKQAVRKYFKEFFVEDIFDRVEFDFYSPRVLLITTLEDGEEISSRVFFCVAIDTYSKIPLAVVTLQERGESADCFRLCVKEAMTETWVSSLSGRVINCRGLIRQAVADAGSGFSQESLINNLVGDFGMIFQTTEVQAPYRKPFAENFIHQIKTQFEPLLPGSYDNIRAEGHKGNVQKRKALTVEQYCNYLIDWIVDSYAQTKQTGDTLTPNEKWLESYQRTKPSVPADFDKRFSRSGTLHTGLANYRSGINKNYAFYNSPELQKMLNIESSTEVEFYVDELDVSAIYVINPNSPELIKVQAIKPVILEGTTLKAHKEQVNKLFRNKPIEVCEHEYAIREQARKETRKVKEDKPKNKAPKKTDAEVTGYEVNDLNKDLLEQTVNIAADSSQSSEPRTVSQQATSGYAIKIMSKKRNRQNKDD